MKKIKLLCLIILSISCLPLYSLDAITIEGKAFIQKSSNGVKQRFNVRGVVLSSNNSNKDLLADDNYDNFLTNILPKLKDLNINLVRIFYVDPNLSHNKIMDLLKNNQIYILLEIFTENLSLNRVTPIYSKNLYERMIAVVDVFAKYDNLFGFSVGNEIVFPGIILDYVQNKAKMCNPSQDMNECYKQTKDIERRDAAISKSMMRDIKKYLAQKKLRNVPVGISMQDSPQYLVPNLIGTDVASQYYACGDSASRADFIGINSYRYIDDMNAYDAHANDVKDLPVPVFLTEAGGRNAGTKIMRNWKITSQFYSSPLIINQLSGQVAFQFFNKNENLGLFCELANGVDSLKPSESDCFNLNVYSQTPYGGIQLLAEQNKTSVQREPIALPTNNPAQINCPAQFSPDLVPSPVDIPQTLITINIKNYSNLSNIVVKQDADKLLATLSAGSGENPSILPNLQIDPNQTLYLLQNTNSEIWPMVCQVRANTLKNGFNILNNVPWGNDCNVGQ